ncbi:hypothetical protein QUF70_14240 [Desulfobacterales bacterium HSG17]|nr:hypothetical protein [Desulfobacterales bacterium HSG17]
MTNKLNHQHGYSKKELVEIIEKIDADRKHLKNQTENSNTDSKNKNSYFSSKYGENR